MASRTLGRQTLTIVVGAALAAGLGCAGARYELRADDARYPVSMSPALPDSDGTILYVRHGLSAVGTFSEEVRKVGFLYGATGGTLDISEIVNREVARFGGDGVTDLALESSHCGTNWLFPLTLLPFWPGCEVATISGVVVRSTRTGAPAPAVASGRAGP